MQEFLGEFNAAYHLERPVTMDDVSMWNAGLVLFGDNQASTTDLSYGKRSLIVDHAAKNGVDSLITLVGVRYTTARGMAKKAVNLVFKKLGRKAPRSDTATTPVYGGQVEHFSEFSRQVMQRRPRGLESEVTQGLLRNYGSAYREVLQYTNEEPAWSETLGNSTVIKAEVVHAVRDEMTQKLGDVVFRRTDLGAGGHPGEDALRTCADLMALELGWNQERKHRELEEVRAAFPKSAVETHWKLQHA